MINYIISLKQRRFIFCTFFEYALLFLNDNMDEGYQEKTPPPEKIPQKNSPGKNPPENFPLGENPPGKISPRKKSPRKKSPILNFFP